MIEENLQLSKNTCVAWIDKLNNLKEDYEEFIQNGNASTYINERIKSLKRYNPEITEDEIKKSLKNQYEGLNELEFSDITDRPVFTINKTGVAALHQIKNSYVRLEDIIKHYNTNGYYIYERVIYDYIRPYFDLDFKMFTVDDVKTTLNFIYEIIKDFKTYAEGLTVVGIAELNSSYFTDSNIENEFINTLNSYEGMLTFKNNTEEFTKGLSIHIYVKGVCFNTDELKDYVKDKIQDRKLSGFDLSVYKTKKGNQQMFRVPYSGKAGDIPRPANPEILDYMKNKDRKKFIVENCVICAGNGDYIIRHIAKPEEVKTQSTKTTSEARTTTNEDNEDISIFKFLTIDDEFQDAEQYFEDFNHFEFGQKLYWLLQGLPLDEDEFLNEILLINPSLNVDKFKSKYTYVRDYKCLFKLEVIKSEINEQIDILTSVKDKTPEDVNLLKTLRYITMKLKSYIEKYEKNDFIEHIFYDVKELKKGLKGKIIPKRQKIKYNCFKTVDDEAIYYIKDGKILSYKNKKSMENDLRMSGELTKDVYESLVCFKNVNEFILMRLKKKYDDEPNKDKKSVDDLLKMLRESFVHEDDFKFYISWLAYKVTYKTTNYRSIICQGDKETGQNALKTYITQLLSPFIEVKNADVRNLNKNLNGGYLTGHLTVIEELPRNIKDVYDFITVLKANSGTETMSIEEKSENPRNIENNTDFIINTNYNVSQMFYNKADAVTLSKRFRILTRQTIDVIKYSDTLDKYGRVGNKDHFNGFCFYMYLYNNEELINYYNIHRNDKSETEQLYISASTNDSTDKIDTNQTEEEFVEWFKKRFTDKNKQLKIKSFIEYLIRNNIFKDIKQATLKQQLLMSKCLHVEGKHNKVTIDEIKNIYAKYFNYVEASEEEEEDEEGDEIDN